MCGFAGFVSRSALGTDSDVIIARMTDTIVHRGPDDAGTWVDRSAGVALGHRRLSIIDLSAAGHQPMPSASGRYVIAYNGEIYNFRTLRHTLEQEGLASPWRGDSDTEVLLVAIEAWGLVEALRRTSGMFAFALWDRKEQQLFLARDRMGEKPLYYGWQGQGEGRAMLFGSDLSSLRQHPAFTPELDEDAVNMLFRYLYIPDPHSIYRGIQKLRPGTYLSVCPGSGKETITTYWDTLAIAAEGQKAPFQGSPQEAVDQLSNLLGQAVERQMVADVPLGAFLSGGIDSSAIVALMQSRSHRPIKTFTIGFTEKAYNEADHARAVANHLGTDHTEMIVSPADVLSVVPMLSKMYTEPFADSSQLPTFLVSRLARQSVTVSLSGDAGDELFGGYNRYRYAQQYWRLINCIPTPARGWMASILQSVSPAQWDRALGFILRNSVRNPGEKIHKSASVLQSDSIDALYRGLLSINANANDLTARPAGDDGFTNRDLVSIESLDPIERMMALDAIHYLPNDILAKVDRASMAVSLESRIPMLDPEVVRFAWTLPMAMKIRDGVTKWPLRQLLYRHVPQKLVERPKTGFGIPIGDWLRGPLRDWAEDLLDPRDLAADPLLNARAVLELWKAHLSGSKNMQHQLWPILIFRSWGKN